MSELFIPHVIPHGKPALPPLYAMLASLEFGQGIKVPYGHEGHMYWRSAAHRWARSHGALIKTAADTDFVRIKRIG